MQQLQKLLRKNKEQIAELKYEIAASDITLDQME